MWCVVALATREVRRSGRCFGRVGYCVSQVSVVMECSTEIMRVCGGVIDVAAVEYGS